MAIGPISRYIYRNISTQTQLLWTSRLRPWLGETGLTQTEGRKETPPHGEGRMTMEDRGRRMNPSLLEASLIQIFKQDEILSSYLLRRSLKSKHPPPSQRMRLWLVGRISGHTHNVLCPPKALPLRLFSGSGRGFESWAVGGDHGCAQIRIN